jgi:hypothetical protein
MTQYNGGNFIADGSAVNVDVGFIPDTLIGIEGFEETSPNIHIWQRSRGDTANDNGQYGVIITGTTGVVTKHADAANGFIAYDTDSDGVLIPAPDGDGEVPATVVEYADASTPTARTVTGVGTVVRPSTRTSYVYECTTSTGAVDAEPTWPTTPGESVTDAESNVWITREEHTVNNGAKGFTIGSTLSTDSDEWSWSAFAADKISDEKDAATSDPV